MSCNNSHTVSGQKWCEGCDLSCILEQHSRNVGWVMTSALLASLNKEPIVGIHLCLQCSLPCPISIVFWIPAGTHDTPKSKGEQLYTSKPLLSKRNRLLPPSHLSSEARFIWAVCPIHPQIVIVKFSSVFSTTKSGAGAVFATFQHGQIYTGGTRVTMQLCSVV